MTKQTELLMGQVSEASPTRRIVADVAFSFCSATIWITPFFLPTGLFCFGNLPFLFAIGVIAAQAVVLVPFAILGHLAKKPIVYAEDEEIIVVPNAGGSTKQYRKPRGSYKLKSLPDGRLELRCFPYHSNFRPGGDLPSRMVLIPRKSDAEEWKELAAKSS